MLMYLSKNFFLLEKDIDQERIRDKSLDLVHKLMFFFGLTIKSHN